MIDLWLFMMHKSVIILEIQGVFQLGKDWRSIQHSQNCIWDWGVDNVWLRISWWYDKFMFIYDEYNGNNIGGSVKQKLRESWRKRSDGLWLWEKQVIFEDESFESFPSWVFGFPSIKFQKDFVFSNISNQKTTFS